MKTIIIHITLTLLFLYSILFTVIYKKKCNTLTEEIKKIQALSDKHFRLFRMMDHWVKAKMKQKSVADYLREKNIKNVAIYGLSYVGQTLTEELENENITVLYGIDQNPEFYCQEFEVYTINDNLPDVDMIIVTPIMSFKQIKEMLTEKVSAEIVSIEDIIDYI